VLARARGEGFNRPLENPPAVDMSGGAAEASSLAIVAFPLLMLLLDKVRCQFLDRVADFIQGIPDDKQDEDDRELEDPRGHCEHPLGADYTRPALFDTKKKSIANRNPQRTASAAMMAQNTPQLKDHTSPSIDFLVSP